MPKNTCVIVIKIVFSDPDENAEIEPSDQPAASEAGSKIRAALKKMPEVSLRYLRRQTQRISSEQFEEAAKSLEEAGLIEISIVKPPTGRPKVVYKNRSPKVDDASS